MGGACLHRFCYSCISQWTKQQREHPIPADERGRGADPDYRCPLCKQPYSYILHDCVLDSFRCARNTTPLAHTNSPYRMHHGHSTQALPTNVVKLPACRTAVPGNEVHAFRAYASFAPVAYACQGGVRGRGCQEAWGSCGFGQRHRAVRSPQAEEVAVRQAAACCQGRSRGGRGGGGNGRVAGRVRRRRQRTYRRGRWIGGARGTCACPSSCCASPRGKLPLVGYCL